MDKKIKDRACRIIFSKGLYAAEAVKLAAYIFSDRAGIRLSPSARGVEAEVSPLSGGSSRGDQNRAVAGEFANEVLNQQCRLDLAAGNGKISGMIVTRALLSALGETGKDKGRTR